MNAAVALPAAVEAARPLLAVLDMAGVAVFAVSGALAAARAKQTIVTFAFFAAVTGIGGGTLRDLLIGAPVFWVGRSDYLAVCLIAAGAVWLLRADRWRLQALLWFDALGMGAYAVIGAAKAQNYGVPPLPAVVMGVLTASFGGIVRDVLAGEPSVLLRREIYVSAAALGAASFVGLSALGLAPLSAGIIGAAAGFGLRAVAITTGLALPGYRTEK
ncbi:trimeric intracellular cation channel family protein [Sandarakinorhabdus sp.]|uniref:trimeric intracellular cation channel family protein n=1 Tax=Sandarakinorhabdus sp. TaxID=1916663 RepID=UPI00286E7A0C|nr:trimeric intracellular cation channel family protein [Sandarakinorhabdus sp.]